MNVAWAGDNYPYQWTVPSNCSCGNTAGCHICMPGNYFSGIGPVKQTREFRTFSIRDAWTCPVCKKGNAPHADKCGHCSDKIHPHAEALKL